MTPPSLLPLRPQFRERLAAARGLAYPFFRGLHPRSALSGPPTEFEGHRPYLPGDDTRWIDWNLFARLEELFVKVFRVEEEVEVLLMVDASLSMHSVPGRKYSVASAAAAALTYLALLTSHPITVLRYAEEALDSEGPWRHMYGFPQVTNLLLSAPGGRGTDLWKSLSPFQLRRRRPLTVIALSDGFQREPLEEALAVSAGRENRRTVFIRIVDPGDLRPSLRGNLHVEDVEGGGSRSLVADRALEQQFHRRISHYFEKLEGGLVQAGCEVLSLAVDSPFEEGFLDMLTTALPAELREAQP